MADKVGEWGPKKDYSESHGMTHGAFRDYLKTNGEAKSSEQLATERAVQKARANVAAKQKVAQLQAGGRKMDGKLMNAELEAQAARAQALAHLQKHSCGPSQFELTGVVAKTSTSDNTLEVVAKRKAKAKAAELAKTNALKLKLLQQQQELRTGSNNNKDDNSGNEIPEFWKEVKDPKTGAIYYWNELTNETSWETPKAASSKTSSNKKKSLPFGWKEVLHESTGQVMYENESTKERRWEAPNGFDDVSDIKPQEGAFEESNAAPLKFSLGAPKIVKGEKKRKNDQTNDKDSKFDWQKKHNKIDPLDPLGQEKGKEGRFSANGERMADSTASGPLFQQRPYPAPGSVLRGGDKKK